MATDTLITFSDGKLSLPQEVQEKMHLTEGVRLRMLSSSDTELRLEVEPVAAKSQSVIQDWRSLRGILSGLPDQDTGRIGRQEREWELEHDERKFGPFPKREI